MVHIPYEPSSYAQDNPPTTPAIPIAPIGTHPRLLISQPYLDTVIQPHIDDNTVLWQDFITYVVDPTLNNGLNTYPESVMRSLGLAWLMTGDVIYREKAISGLQRVVNWIEDSPVMSTSPTAWDTDFLKWVTTLAIGYDWFYEALEPADRDILADVLIRATRRLLNPFNDTGLVWISNAVLSGNPADDFFLFHAFNSESAQWVWAITATALALQGESDEAADLVDTIRNIWIENVIPALEFQPNGSWAGGTVDGFMAGWWHTQTALAWWTARGENYFDDTTWWYERLAYNLFLHYPDIRIFGDSEGGDAFLDYPNIIGDGERNHPNAFFSHAQSLLLGRVFNGTPYANWTSWVIGQTTSPSWLLVDYLLWQPRETAAEPPTINTWRSIGTNHVFMRSHWANTLNQLDSTATYVSFYAGDYFSPRQFFDQGSFTIWRDEVEFITRGGLYSGHGDSNHDANYYGRSIGGNTLLICDLSETFENIRLNTDTRVWLNDCGQRSVDTVNLGAVNTNYFVQNRARFDTANILRQFDNDQVTYIYADITAAYNSIDYVSPNNQAKTQSVVRELVYIRPSAILVHDRFINSQPNLTTMNILHFPNRPQREGDRWVLREGSSALFLQQLTPNSQSEIVEGYITAGQDVSTAFGQVVRNQYEDTLHGWYRMDTVFTQPTLTPWFLSSFNLIDSRFPPPPVVTLVEGQGIRGAVISSPDVRWQVMFDDDPQNITQAVFDVVIGTQHLLITGLVPEQQYTLRWSNGLTEIATTHGAGTLLLNSSFAGTLEISLGD